MRGGAGTCVTVKRNRLEPKWHRRSKEVVPTSAAAPVSIEDAVRVACAEAGRHVSMVVVDVTTLVVGGETHECAALQRLSNGQLCFFEQLAPTP